ncbi:MAG: hypothetical protein ACK559_22680, partial [bacterium]
LRGAGGGEHGGVAPLVPVVHALLGGKGARPPCEARGPQQRRWLQARSLRQAFRERRLGRIVGAGAGERQREDGAGRGRALRVRRQALRIDQQDGRALRAGRSC